MNVVCLAINAVAAKRPPLFCARAGPSSAPPDDCVAYAAADSPRKTKGRARKLHDAVLKMGEKDPPYFFPPAESEQQVRSRAQAIIEFMEYYNEQTPPRERKALNSVSDCLDEQEEAERLVEVARGDCEFDSDDVTMMLEFYERGCW